MGIENAVGVLLRGVRVGPEKLLMHHPAIASAPECIEVTSIFANEGALPAMYTIDGDRGSPPLTWTDCGTSALSYAVVIEDVDVPLPQPIVHGIAYGISADITTLPENALPRAGMPVMSAFSVGRNSLGKQTFLPPEPIRGHGMHQYVFQVFALDTPIVADAPLHLSELRDRMSGHVLARGYLIGTYERA